MDNYGFRWAINSWFQSYLTNRKQKVVINEFEPENSVLSDEVPQGSALGKILLSIHFNDLNRIEKYSITRHFADDTNRKKLFTTFSPIRKWVKNTPYRIGVNCKKEHSQKLHKT